MSTRRSDDDPPIVPQSFRSWTGFEPPARTIAGRYRLGEALGAGGAGEVFRADDLLTSEVVAVKLLSPMSTEQLARVRREVAALRILRLPGVVRILDDGVFENQHFIVMEILSGTRFPGPDTDGTWATVGPRAIRLLEAIALVHSAGVVHRDLKPANILVDARGRPTILDFGIARGVALGETITSRTALLGTPRYLAPEQLYGKPVDARADLYAFGVMLFECLAGRPPHPSGDLNELYIARVTKDAPRIEHYAPDLPAGVAAVINRLLARWPEERPRSAVEALADLGGDGVVVGGTPQLPRLGGDDVVQAIVSAVMEHKSLFITGARGSGRTRALRDAAELLSRGGRRVAWTVLGARPYESVRPLLGDPPTDRDPMPILAERLAGLLNLGVAVFVDGAESLDRWSANLLNSAQGAIIRAAVTTPGPSLALPPLTHADLFPLFHGPDRLLHLQEDGATALFARAGGVPSRVAMEATAWVSAGLADWKDGRLVVTRNAIEQLGGGLHIAIPLLPEGERPARLDAPLEDLVAWVAMAWPDATRDVIVNATGLPAWEVHVELDELMQLGAVRVLPDGRLQAAIPDARSEWPEDRRRATHAALAGALPPGTMSRFHHLVACESHVEAVDEALALARAYTASGQVGRAAGVATLGLSVARQVEGAPGEAELLEELVIDALKSWTVVQCETALYEIGRATKHGARLDQLAVLLRASLDAWRGKADAALAAVEAVPPFADDETECWRQTVRVHVASHWSVSRHEELMVEVAEWAHASERRDALYTGWLGLLRYRQGRFDEAAVLHTQAASARKEGAARLSAMLNGAAALVDAFRFEDASALAQRAFDIAKECRLAAFEGRAEWVLRSAAYRLGRATVPDHALIEAVAAVRLPGLEAQICLTEAAVAWRAGDLGTAAMLAGIARSRWTVAGFTAGSALAEALEIVASDTYDIPRIRELGARALRGAAPRLTLQTLGLLAHAAPTLAAGWNYDARRLATATRERHWDLRNEVLAIREALAYCSPSPKPMEPR